MNFDVLYEDNHLLVVSKPAGLLVQGDASGQRNLLDLVKEYRKLKENKRGNVFVGLVHRLDRPVSGVLVFARTSKAASRLSEQFRAGSVNKRYLAVVEAPGDPQGVGTSGVWDDTLTKDQATNYVTVVASVPPASISDRKLRGAQTAWQQRAAHGDLWLLELHPLTGRGHQLRVQSASRGMPIVGDKKYGSGRTFSQGIALHAWQLSFRHPTRDELLEFACPPPDSWKAFPFQLP